VACSPSRWLPGRIPVFLLLFLNGLTLGAFSALFASRGLAGDFWGWVLPHGLTELLAVVLCAGGLVLAQALLFPGPTGGWRTSPGAGARPGCSWWGAAALLPGGLLEASSASW